MRCGLSPPPARAASDPSGDALARLLRRGDGPAGLADPTRSGQREQADLRASEEVAEPGPILLAVDQPGWLRREGL